MTDKKNKSGLKPICEGIAVFFIFLGIAVVFFVIGWCSMKFPGLN